MTREEAIEVLKVVDENASCDDCLYYAQMEDCPTDDDCIIRKAISMAISALEQEPSHKGHWIENRKYRHENFSLWTCSECTYEVNSAYDLSYFCPNCGADMRGAE